MEELRIKPIGYIQTPYNDRYEAPRQPGVGVSREGVVTLEAGMNFEQALADLDGFDRIWLLYWFDRNPNWKPMVLTPRSGTTKRGLFSTRSPHRPNPMGMSVVDLLGIKGRILRVGNVDLLDGTPILDIKPYLPYADAYPDSKTGWVSDLSGKPVYEIIWSELAEDQSNWLAQKFGVELKSRVIEVLSQNPDPHPYRRISETLGSFQLAIRSWRVDFEVLDAGEKILVKQIKSGYSISKMAIEPSEEIHDQRAHIDFHERWPEEGT